MHAADHRLGLEAGASADHRAGLEAGPSADHRAGPAPHNLAVSLRRPLRKTKGAGNDIRKLPHRKSVLTQHPSPVGKLFFIREKHLHPVVFQQISRKGILFGNLLENYVKSTSFLCFFQKISRKELLIGKVLEISCGNVEKGIDFHYFSHFDMQFGNLLENYVKSTSSLCFFQKISRKDIIFGKNLEIPHGKMTVAVK